MCSICADSKFERPDYQTTTLQAAADFAGFDALPADDPRPSARDLAEDRAENRREMRVSSR